MALSDQEKPIFTFYTGYKKFFPDVVSVRGVVQQNALLSPLLHQGHGANLDDIPCTNTIEIHSGG